MLFGETQCIQVSFIEPITMWNTEIYASFRSVFKYSFLELTLKICILILSSHCHLALLLHVQLHKSSIHALKTKKTQAFKICFVSDVGGRAQQKSGPVVLADEVKNPAMEKLELVRKWSLNTYKVCRQTFVCVYMCILDMSLLLEAFQVLYCCMKVICCYSEHKQECTGKA